MSETISILANICGIMGFLLSLYATSQILKIKQKIEGDNNTTTSFTGSVGGDFIGRDKN